MAFTENEIDIYNKAIIAFLTCTWGSTTGPTPPGGPAPAPVPTPVTHIFATPERAFATIAQAPLTGAQDYNRVKLPVMSTSIGDISDHNEIFNAGRVKIDQTPSTDPTSMRRMLLPPQPVTITYRTNVWCRSFESLQSIQIQLKSKFISSVAYIEADFTTLPYANNYGVHRYSLMFEGITDNSDLEPKESERLLRVTMTTRLNCILWRGLESVKTVREVDYRNEVVNNPNQNPSNWSGFTGGSVIEISVVVPPAP